MPALLIKNLPTTLHRKLKQVARRDRRSMNQEVMVLLEEALSHPKRRLVDHYPRRLRHTK